MRQLTFFSHGILLLGVVLYILLGALNYQSTRVHYENINDFIPASLALNGNKLTAAQDYKNLLNMALFETNQPRYTRPLSNLVMMLNHKIRSKMWAYVLPHPTLSPLLLFPFILTPLFLYLSLRRWQYSPLLALGLCTFYLATPGSLATFVETFRPGKMMVNFSFFFFWYLTQKKVEGKGRGFHFFYWLSFALSFFWDETFILVWASVLLLFPAYWWRQKKEGAILLSLPLFYYLMVFYFLPYVAAKQHFLSLPMSTYHVIKAWPEVITSFFASFWINFRLLFADLLGIHSPHLPVQFLGKAIFYVNRCGLLALVMSLPFFLFAQWKKEMRRDLFFFSAWAVVFLVLVGLHNALMISVHSFVHGLFYYGAYLCPLAVLFLAQFFVRYRLPPLFLLLFLAVSLPAMIYKFHFYNLGIKYPAPELYQGSGLTTLTLDQVNRYQNTPPSSEKIIATTQKYWASSLRSAQMKGEIYAPENFEYRYIFLESPARVIP